MKKITLVKILSVLGILLLLSGVGSSSTSQGDTSYSFTGGAILLLGALACRARKEQFLHSSKKWLVTEIISLLVVLWVTISGLAQGLWYLHPVSFTIIPLVVLCSWLYTLFRKQPAKVQ